MRVITPLACGIVGAESGFAQVYKRKTAVKATYYTSFEGDGGSSLNVPLDQYGSANVYVNEVVDVKVYDSSSNLVRSFTAGETAAAVEVKSQSFTGVDYDTAISAAGKPTTLQKMADAWYDSTGSTDFMVNVNGNKTKLSTLVGFVFSSVFNVKDEAYGAVGDGLTDDSAAIQAAINAAEAVGGGQVFLPSGTYYIGTGLSVEGDVTLIGDSDKLSIISVDYDSVSKGIEFLSGYVCFLKNLTVEYNNGTTPTASTRFLIDTDADLTIEDCVIGASSVYDNRIDVINCADGNLVVRNCTIYTEVCSLSASSCIRAATSVEKVYLENCIFKTVGNQNVTTNILELVSGFAVVNSCEFQTTTTLSQINYAQITGASVIFTACKFGNPSSGAANGIDNTSGNLRVIGCIFESSVLGISTSTDVIQTGVRGYLDAGVQNGTPYTVNPHLSSHVRIERTNSTAQTINLNTSGVTVPEGSEVVIIIESTGSTAAITWGGSILDVAGATLTSGKRQVFRFVYTNGFWVESGTTAATA